jgi:hypothetical protein
VTPLAFLAKSPSFIFVFLLYAINLFQLIGRAIKISKIKFLCLLYVFFVSVVSLCLFWGQEVYGRNLIIKGINLLILNLFFLFPFFVDFCFNEKSVKMAFLFAIFLCLLGVVLGDYIHVSFIETGVFQMSERPSTRPRGFSYEPSMLSVTVFSLLFAYFCLGSKSGKLSIINILVLLVVAILTTSKGAMATFLLAIFFTYFLSKSLFTMRGLFFSILIIGLFIPVVQYLMSMVVLDMENNTSIATRSIAILSSIFSVLEHPFGVGTFGFLYSFKYFVAYAIDWFESFDQFGLLLYEAMDYLNAKDDSSIGTKSFFFNSLMCFGFPFLFAFILYVLKKIKQCRSLNRRDLEVGFWFVIISLVSFTEGIGLYPLSLFVVVLNFELKKTETLGVKVL